MKIYIVTTIHKGFEYNELYGSLIPEVFKEHTDALDFCKMNVKQWDMVLFLMKDHIINLFQKKMVG